jgi:hypothetical protein
MPKAFSLEFRRDVVTVARKNEAPIAQIAKDFGVSESCLHRWPQLTLMRRRGRRIVFERLVDRAANRSGDSRTQIARRGGCVCCAYWRLDLPQGCGLVPGLAEAGELSSVSGEVWVVVTNRVDMLSPPVVIRRCAPGRPRRVRSARCARSRRPAGRLQRARIRARPPGVRPRCPTGTRA